MAPFDFNYVEDDLSTGLSGPTAVAVTLQPAMPPAVLPTVLNGSFVAATADADATDCPLSRRAYPLAENTGLGSSIFEAEDYAGSLRTDSYAEYLLQVLDKNATMTSIVFILAYAGILHSL